MNINDVQLVKESQQWQASDIKPNILNHEILGMQVICMVYCDWKQWKLELSTKNIDISL